MNADEDVSLDESRPDFSIIMGLVSTEDRERVLETLTQLRRQQPSQSYEVVIGDRRCDSLSDRIRDDFPEVQIIEAAPESTLPELRKMALDRCRGKFVVVTEDHCVPTVNWLQAFSDTFNEAPIGTVAVGGSVENGVTVRPLDWATFLCEYSYFLPPVTEGETPVLPGMNVAYRRSALSEVDPDRLTAGFWETTVHPELNSQGTRMYSSNAIRLFHCKRFSFRLFCRQRYVYSRYYAGIRFGRNQRLRRAAACLLSLILPIVLLWRMFQQFRAKKLKLRLVLEAFPALGVFVIIWAIGEMVGYVAGPGRALAEIE